MSINLLGTLMVGFSPLLSLTLRVKVLEIIQSINETFILTGPYMKRGWPLHITSSGKNKDLEADESALTSCTGSVKLLHPILLIAPYNKINYTGNIPWKSCQ
jgi:hypothetical protein